jgi:hypothetical protein
MYTLIVLLTAAAVPIAGASPALAAPSGQSLAVTAVATGSGVGVGTQADAQAATGRQGALVWQDIVAMEPDAAADGVAPAARTLLVTPATAYAEVAPRDQSARAPPRVLSVT